MRHAISYLLPVFVTMSEYVLAARSTRMTLDDTLFCVFRFDEPHPHAQSSNASSSRTGTKGTNGRSSHPLKPKERPIEASKNTLVVDTSNIDTAFDFVEVLTPPSSSNLPRRVPGAPVKLGTRIPSLNDSDDEEIASRRHEGEEAGRDPDSGEPESSMEALQDKLAEFQLTETEGIFEMEIGAQDEPEEVQVLDDEFLVGVLRSLGHNVVYVPTTETTR